ncbi:uncharacterized protein LOC134539821 [Bacillus rossius redtenbacheri]|uniref:uncharacterized protein LOC134539821 n=1 Tax=Bacillus rossius redtenbacheri TaxID=93214 RepID=UPI002FDD06F8
MASDCNNDLSLNSDLVTLQKQLTVARNEICNLRQQMRSLGHAQRKELERIQGALETWRCPGCAGTPPPVPDERVVLRSIGTVTTGFPEKRGTPRQPGVCLHGQGKLTLHGDVFTNPEHALDGLEGFSHMWILFHFHKNDATHLRAKVSPPRLNGARTGVFGTRSPNRPSPIGLSLVAIDRLDGASVYFSGVDMVDGTPVLDIKPYIPQYDNPEQFEPPASPVPRPAAPPEEREAPDGEESAGASLAAPGAAAGPERASMSPSAQVRVPSWVTQPPASKLTVTFSERAQAQLEELGGAGQLAAAIRNVLREDPRSVYLRQRWGSQFYTFLICDLHVGCKFADAERAVTVFQNCVGEECCALKTRFPSLVSAGGSAQNTLRAFQWLVGRPGASVVFGAVGLDDEGRTLEALMRSAGVCTRYVYHSELPTGRCVALVKNEHRALVAHIGAAAVYDSHHLDSDNFHTLARSKIVYVEGFFISHSFAVAEEVFTFCKSRGILTAFNLSSVYICRNHAREILQMVNRADVVFGNRAAYRALVESAERAPQVLVFSEFSGQDEDDDAEESKHLGVQSSVNGTVAFGKQRATPASVFDELRSLGKICVATDGSRPVRCKTSRGECFEVQVPPLDAASVKDTTGAGDAFVAGFLAGVVEHRHLKACIRLGCGVAARVIQQVGCQVPTYSPRQVLSAA